jgi:chromate transporter
MRTEVGPEWREGVLRALFATFFNIGLFTFGGGFAMIPIIEREIVMKRKWISASEVADAFAVAQAVPGSIAINSATFVGYKVAGWRGALAATLGVVLPSFFVILAIAAFFSRFQELKPVQDAFRGIRACIVGLIAYAGVRLALTTVKGFRGVLVLAAALVAVLAFDVDAAIVIAGAIVLGFVFALPFARIAGGSR